MEPVFIKDSVFLKGKGFLQKWKKVYCAVYPRNLFGIERVEIYPSEHDFLLGRHMRTVLLANCISVRMVDSGNRQIPVALQLTINDAKTSHILLGPVSEEQARMWQDALCHAAFPDQYARVTQAKNGSLSPQLSPRSDRLQSDDYDIPWDVQQIRVMLISTQSSSRLGISEGAYDLSFGTEGLILKSKGSIIEAWDYRLITWFGYGPNACCFETEENQTYEFKCAQPESVYENLRNKIHLKLMTSSVYKPGGLKQAYFTCFIPTGKVLTGQRRSIFAPRASIDTALPGIYAVPNKSDSKESSIKLT